MTPTDHPTQIDLEPASFLPSGIALVEERIRDVQSTWLSWETYRDSILAAEARRAAAEARVVA